MCKKVLKADCFNNLSNNELLNLDGGFLPGFGNEAGKDAYHAMKDVAQDVIKTGCFIVGHVFGFFEGLFT